MKVNSIRIDLNLLLELLENAKAVYPREVILLLRGKEVRKKPFKEIKVTDYLIPPQSILGLNFSSFNLSLLPFDPNVVGTFHSHPSGCIFPSIADLNNFIGLFVAVAAYPYGPANVAAYDKNGKPIPIVVEKP